MQIQMDRLSFAHFGKPLDVLGLESSYYDESKHDAVVVRMAAAPINPADLNFIEGTYGVRPELPATPGIEGAGVVIASRHPEFTAGERVMILGRVGAWATHVTAGAEQLLRLPDEIDMQQASMLKVNPATAWRLLHGFRMLRVGDWVVQNAGNSGVGRCVIQLAASLGIRTISMVRREHMIPELLSLGADHVLVDGTEAQTHALELMGGRRAQIACNAVGGESALRLMNLLGDGGDHITYGAMARRPLTVPNGLLIFRNLAIRGLWVSRWLESTPIDALRSVYQDLAKRVIDGGLVQPVDSCFTLAEFESALSRQGESGRSGKVLFTMED